MFEFLKDIFGKEKELEVVAVSEPGIKAFLYKENKLKKDSMIIRSKSCIDAINGIIIQTRKLLLSLEDAELHNKKITGQEMNFMVGNRKAYIKNTRDFLDFIEKISGFDSPEEIMTSILNAKKHVEILSRNNQRPYAVMQHFFANESRTIGNHIKDIIDQYDLLEKYFLDSGINELNDALSFIERREEKQKARKILEDEIIAKKEHINENIISSKKAKTQLKMFENGSDFSDFKRINLEKERIINEIKSLESELLMAFDPIDSALKKYSRVAEDKKIIELILKSPIDAVSIESRKTVIMLAKFYDAVSKETIELKDRKKDKVLSAINRLSQGFFDSFINKHNVLKREKHEIEEKLRQNRIMRDYEDILYRIKHLESREGILKADIESIEKKAEKIEQFELDSVFINKISAITGKSVKIKY
jgi:hypothetical protein